MTPYMLCMGTIWQREIVRFVRQRSRIIGAFGQPILFWLLLGSGFGRNFRYAGGGGEGYLEYFYPGIIAMVVLFTAIFSTFAVVDDRKARFLQGVLAAPVPRSAIVLGQVMGGATLALLQGILLLIATPLAGVPLTLEAALASVLVMGLIGFALTALGLLLAWRIESTQGFHSIMNLLLIPLWLLSGSGVPGRGRAPAHRHRHGGEPAHLRRGGSEENALPERAGRRGQPAGAVAFPTHHDRLRRGVLLARGEDRREKPRGKGAGKDEAPRNHGRRFTYLATFSNASFLDMGQGGASCSCPAGRPL